MKITNLVLAKSYREFIYFLHYYGKKPEEFKYIATYRDLVFPSNLVLTGRYKERPEWEQIQAIIDSEFTSFYSVMEFPLEGEYLC